MKELLALIFCILLTNLFSQVWIDNGAQWTFDYSNVSESGTWRWEYTHDTIIQGHQSQVINGTQYRYGGPGTAIINTGETYTYHSNDSVFYFKDNQFFLLYDFGAQIGDTWVVSIDTNFSACEDSAVVEVTDTGTMLINGVNYRTITLETISASLYALNGLCVERFGIIPTSYQNNNFGFVPGYQYCPNGPIIDYPLLTFRCYEDSTFPTYNPTSRDCDTLTLDLSNELTIDDIKIYPVPSSNSIQIESTGKTISSVEILDMNLRTIVRQPFKGNIDISELNSGVYFIRIITENKNQFLRKFVKR